MKERVGVLGAGNMAEALVRGWLSANLLQVAQVGVSDVSAERLEFFAREFGVTTHADNAALVESADIVVLAVKPQTVDAVLSQAGSRLRNQTTLVSIAAGVSIERLAKLLPAGSKVVRAMPNTPALVQSGITALAHGPKVSESDLLRVQALFDAVGQTVLVPESAMNAVTGLSGSGPAYVLLVIEALAEGGVRAGLGRPIATALAAQTVLGTAKLLIERGAHPAILRESVTSPAGTTSAGIFALESGGLRSTLMNAVAAATARAEELGRGR